MKSRSQLLPNIFLIESLDFTDETCGHFEGEIISKILNLSGVHCEYFRIRTRSELVQMMVEFNKSGYKYLHISMHGNADSLRTTLDELPFADLSLILQNSLDNKRLFISACSAVNEKLANRIFGETECLSIIGHNEELDMNDAAIFWASFYHLMFKNDKGTKVMMYKEIKRILQNLIDTFNVPITYFNRYSENEKGYRKVLFQ